MQVDIAQCLIKMATIHFKSEDVLQTIQMQTKGIIMMECILDPDSSLVAFAYSKLAM
jgi:hypothetical protein